jgi:hypothetical protein
MTSSTNPAGIPIAADIVSDDTDAAEGASSGPIVGASDADADAARTGADVDLDGATRDSDGVPVGRADADEDARRGGGDPTGI